jgi:hypothetical protein
MSLYTVRHSMHEARNVWPVEYQDVGVSHMIACFDAYFLGFIKTFQTETPG